MTIIVAMMNFITKQLLSILKMEDLVLNLQALLKTPNICAKENSKKGIIKVEMY